MYGILYVSLHYEAVAHTVMLAVLVSAQPIIARIFCPQFAWLTEVCSCNSFISIILKEKMKQTYVKRSIWYSILESSIVYGCERGRVAIKVASSLLVLFPCLASLTRATRCAVAVAVVQSPVTSLASCEANVVLLCQLCVVKLQLMFYKLYNN